MRRIGGRPLRRRAGAVAVLIGASVLGAGCGSSARGSGNPASTASGGTAVRAIRVVAAENFWGSIASQLGGEHTRVESIIADPNVDPHSYEPTPKDARTLESAQLIIVNGVGYDPWSEKLLAADSGHPEVLNVGTLLGLKAGDNPHRWYNPADVDRVVTAISSALSGVDPADSPYFRSREVAFEGSDLSTYHSLISQIRSSYSGTPVGASESIFSMMSPALGLDLLTPASFLRAISEGTDVSAGDKRTIDDQIKNRQIKLYVYNSQNTTPDVQTQLSECKAANIPTATITETLVPPTATFQDWQAHELQGILDAFHRATGR